jgi:hypothetical protein
MESTLVLRCRPINVCGILMIVEERCRADDSGVEKEDLIINSRRMVEKQEILIFYFKFLGDGET